KNLSDTRFVADVAEEEPVRAVLADLLEILLFGSRRIIIVQIIQNTDVMAFLNQPGAEMRSDKTSPASNQNVHFTSYSSCFFRIANKAFPLPSEPPKKDLGSASADFRFRHPSA